MFDKTIALAIYLSNLGYTHVNGQWLTVWAALQNGRALSGGEAAAQQNGNKLFYNKFSSLINLILYPANVTNSNLQGAEPSFL